MQKTIARINKNVGETVVISLSEFKGKELIDIRIWLRPSDPREEEEWGKLTPTKKGISMGIESIPGLIEALQKAQESLENQSQDEQL